ncbi:hypothetical protein DXX98_03015 [Janibacter melonis]|nr:hypothetical protein [Janibacter melonis]
MGYRLSDSEVEDFQTRVKGTQYVGDGLDVYFTTTREFLAEVLPPCFGVPEEPVACLQYSGAVGAKLEFRSLVLYVAATFRGQNAFYDLTHLLTGDMTITIGRELWGECKKQADITATATEGRMQVSAVRNGTQIIGIDAEIGPDLGPRDSAGNRQVHVKAFLDSDGTDLEYDPIVFVLTSSTHYESYHEGTASIELTSTPGDPCGSVPVVSVDRAVYGRRRSSYTQEHFPVDGRQEYLPYVIGRSYDFMS